MCTRYKKQIIFIFIFCLFFVVNMFLNKSIGTRSYYESRKYAEDYSAVDLLKIQKILLGMETATEKTFKKYDINEDGEITYTDLQIIQHMNIKIYDAYVIKNNKKYVIKFTEN